MDEIYKITKWKTFDNYECLFCPYATLDRDEANGHWQAKHALPQPPPPPESLPPKKDRFGNLVEEVAGEEKE